MAGSKQPPFSARNRGSHRQIDNEFPPTARTALLHLLCDLVSKQYVDGWSTITNELQRIGRLPPVEYETSSVESMRRAKKDAEAALAELKWDKVYDFCERLYWRLAREVGYYGDRDEYTVGTSKDDVQAYIAAEMQQIFMEEVLAFEFSEGIVRRRGRRHTVDLTTRAQVVLGDARLASARKHYEKALQFFRNPSNPDYENAVKEAVCAVEAAGRALFPEAKAATLGDLAKWLVAAKDVSVPKALGQTITAVYAYRSGGDGIGHGGSSGGVATTEVAEYVLAVCASQVIYLVDLANSREAEIPF